MSDSWQLKSLNFNSEMENGLSLTLDALNEKYAIVSVVPPTTGERTPVGKNLSLPRLNSVDVCCVVDISGSMATSASISTSAGVEGVGLIILDIVRQEFCLY